MDFLRLTGGADITNNHFSLGIYGVFGINVPSLEDYDVIDRGSYFVFGDVVFSKQEDICYFAFDSHDAQDSVYFVKDMPLWAEMGYTRNEGFLCASGADSATKENRGYSHDSCVSECSISRWPFRRLAASLRSLALPSSNLSVRGTNT